MMTCDTLIDRQDQLRKSEATLLQLWNQSNARVLPVHDGKCLIQTVNGQPHLVRIPVQEPWQVQNAIFLGTSLSTPLVTPIDTPLPNTDETVPWFALSLDEKSIRTLNLPDNTEFQDLRAVGQQLGDEDYALLKYAKGLTYWHSTTRFCSRCGSGLTDKQGGHSKQCTNDSCGAQLFPRTDPAVIMLVTRTDETGEQWCLLGRSPVWPKGMYSTLAGFVESGESLEQAVAREVFEEAGIYVEDAKYVRSQPWPFPRSIMLGFSAVATSKDITLDETELEDARWFTRAELKTFGNWGDENHEFQLPRTDSIAYHLVNRWIHAQD